MWELWNQTPAPQLGGTLGTHVTLYTLGFIIYKREWMKEACFSKIK